MTLRSKYIYPISSLFIISWWLLAFHRPVAYEGSNSFTVSAHQPPVVPSIEANNYLFTDRAALKKALDGDVETMGLLITQWDLEAELAERPLKRLDRSEFLRAQLLVKTLKTKDSRTLDALREQHRPQLLVDDKGHPFDLSHPPEFFLPQTYLSAGILMALVEPSNIVALPRSMRQQAAIYPKERTDLIPHDIDSFHLEQIYAYKPDIALISERYTHPLTLQAFDSQGIPKFHLPEVQSIEDIEQLIRSLGHLSNRPLKAELMAIFLKAGTLALDNERAMALPELHNEKVLILNFYSKFSIPGKMTLTRHMIDRMGVSPFEELKKGVMEEPWSTPVSEEQIIHYNPEKLIIITNSEPTYVKNYFYQSTLFEHIKAAQEDRVTVLDESVQQTISQYILLAYYDLNRALVELHAQ